MTVEATITRELNIRFIDARQLTTAAKLSLDITAYPNAAQRKELVAEATRIFNEDLSSQEKAKMRSNNMVLIATKNNDDLSLSLCSLTSNSCSIASSASRDIPPFSYSPSSSSSRRSRHSTKSAGHSPKRCTRKTRPPTCTSFNKPVRRLTSIEQVVFLKSTTITQ